MRHGDDWAGEYSYLLQSEQCFSQKPPPRVGKLLVVVGSLQSRVPVCGEYPTQPPATQHLAVDTGH
jgi:hypothetical protein